MVTQEQLDLASQALCLPLVLTMNFSLFQYLLTAFYKRRNELRVRLLLFIALLSFASLVPFAYPDDELILNLNDISEVCSVLTFLLQITILTRDVNRKVKIRSLVVCAWVGEALVLLGLLVLLSNVVDLAAPVFDMGMVEEMDNIVENASIIFIVGFRFYFLGMAKGAKTLLRRHKTEMLYYFLFLTHEYPFEVLDHVTGLSWEYVQGIWMRITIVLCLWTTIKAKIASSKGSKALKTTVGAVSGSHQNVHAEPRNAGPVESSVFKPTRAVNHVSVVPLPASKVPSKAK